MAERIFNPEPVRVIIRGAQFYRNDFVELLGLLGRNCNSISVNTIKYRYEPHEIGVQDLEDRVFELLILTDRPSISIDFGIRRVVVYTTGRDNAAVGLAHVVAASLKKKVSWHQRGLLRLWPLMFVSVAAYPVNLYLSNRAMQETTTYAWPYIIAMGATVVGSIFLVEKLGADRTRTYLSSRQQDVAWLKRNRDLTMALTGALFSIALTVLYDMWKR